MPSRLGLTLALLFVPIAPLAHAQSAQYVSASKCRACHLPESKSWEQTKMSQAFELLKPGVRAEAKKAHNLDPDKDYTQDEQCVQCHTTGHGAPGGFESVEKTPNLTGVQCEACHGAGGEFTKPELMSFQNKEFKLTDVVAAGLNPKPDLTTCQTCHNDKNPFNKPFDFETRKAAGVHQQFPLKYAHE